MPTMLSRKMGDNHFIITAELAPPRGSDMGAFLRMAEFVAPHVDAINVTDNQGANMRMTPLTAAALLVREGIEPIMQLTCRDRNRLALQSDLLGAAAMGIHNILALSGDHISCGDHRQGRAVFDLDSVLLIQTIQGLNEGLDINGKPLDGNTTFFAGAAAAPEVEPFIVTRPKLVKKAVAGARFFQTQAVFDPQRLTMFCEAVEPLAVKVIAGILVLQICKDGRVYQPQHSRPEDPAGRCGTTGKLSRPRRRGAQDRHRAGDPLPRSLPWRPSDGHGA